MPRALDGNVCTIYLEAKSSNHSRYKTPTGSRSLERLVPISDLAVSVPGGEGVGPLACTVATSPHHMQVDMSKETNTTSLQTVGSLFFTCIQTLISHFALFCFQFKFLLERKVQQNVARLKDISSDPF